MVARWLQQPQTLCTLNPKAWGKNRASASSNQMQALSLALAGSKPDPLFKPSDHGDCGHRTLTVSNQGHQWPLVGGGGNQPSKALPTPKADSILQSQEGQQHRPPRHRGCRVRGLLWVTGSLRQGLNSPVKGHTQEASAPTPKLGGPCCLHTGLLPAWPQPFTWLVPR